MNHFLRRIAKSSLPEVWRGRLRKLLGIHPPKDSDFSGLTNAEIFSAIYRRHLWGTPGLGQRSFWSGSGTHDIAISSGYISDLKAFLMDFPEKPSIADLGCGDFIMGSNFVSLASKYIACDIFDGVIEENRKIYQGENLEFRVLDLAAGQLPDVDIIIVRQVLQHLSNADIEGFVRNISKACKYLILTEHLPSAPDFPPNLDKTSGPGVRLQNGSGIVLTSPPFDLKANSARTLCEFAEHGGVILTVVYAF